MAIERWTGGAAQGTSWTIAFGSEIQSLKNLNAVLSSISITNGTPMDVFADVCVQQGASSTPVTTNSYVGLYLYPLLQNGTTFGDGQFAAAATGPPPSNYYVGSFGFNANVTITLFGMVQRIVIPPGTFSWVMHSNLNVTFPAAISAYYRTYDRQVT